ncbi:hypothetical protein ACEWY4_002039 [Coilia grayii]|uniref:STRA8 bHLH domain-containing protein n=1 Tax=Coilia grayii TaxID=363190 RepID=A0ABD1KV88_9TELE
MTSRDTTFTSCSLEKKVLDEQQKERRRALQARHRATLASLFDSLKMVVCPGSKKTPAKWKILDHAKGYLKEKESCLSYLLSLKRSYLERDDEPNSLEEVREQFRRLCSKCILEPSSRRGRYRTSVVRGSEEILEESGSEVSPDDPMDDTPFSQSSDLSASNIKEFEGYLYFYRQTLELLVRGGVLSPEQTGLAVVSEAISGLWTNLPPQHRAAFQQCTLGASPYSWMGCFGEEEDEEDGNNEEEEEEEEVGDQQLQLPRGGECSQRSCQFPSPKEKEEEEEGEEVEEGGDGEVSASSLLQEDLLQDAYDVVKKDMDSSALPSPALLPSSGGDFEKLREIYKDIMGFVNDHMAEDLEETELGVCTVVLAFRSQTHRERLCPGTTIIRHQLSSHLSSSRANQPHRTPSPTAAILIPATADPLQ